MKHHLPQPYANGQAQFIINIADDKQTYPETHSEPITWLDCRQGGPVHNPPHPAPPHPDQPQPTTPHPQEMAPTSHNQTSNARLQRAFSFFKKPHYASKEVSATRCLQRGENKGSKDRSKGVAASAALQRGGRGGCFALGCCGSRGGCFALGGFGSRGACCAGQGRGSRGGWFAHGCLGC